MTNCRRPSSLCQITTRCLFNFVSTQCSRERSGSLSATMAVLGTRRCFPHLAQLRRKLPDDWSVSCTCRFLLEVHHRTCCWFARRLDSPCRRMPPMSLGLGRRRRLTLSPSSQNSNPKKKNEEKRKKNGPREEEVGQTQTQN